MGFIPPGRYGVRFYPVSLQKLIELAGAHGCGIKHPMLFMSNRGKEEEEYLKQDKFKLIIVPD